jgi:hypothetical protein
LKKLRCRMRQERSHKPKKSEAIAGKVLRPCDQHASAPESLMVERLAPQVRR